MRLRAAEDDELSFDFDDKRNQKDELSDNQDNEYASESEDRPSQGSKLSNDDKSQSEESLDGESLLSSVNQDINNKGGEDYDFDQERL